MDYIIDFPNLVIIKGVTNVTKLTDMLDTLNIVYDVSEWVTKETHKKQHTIKSVDWKKE